MWKLLQLIYVFLCSALAGFCVAFVAGCVISIIVPTDMGTEIGILLCAIELGCIYWGVDSFLEKMNADSKK